MIMDLNFCIEILHSIGYLEIEEHRITITGNDPILPTSFLIGEAGASAIAAVGYVAAELWRLKTNHAQSISVSVKEAAIAQKSHQYLQVSTMKNIVLWDPISGFYETKDNRWIQFHCNFPHHKQGVLDVLGCGDSPESVKIATKKFSALYLEQTLQNNGMCAAMVRSDLEWQSHPQYQAIESLPLIEIIKIADSPPTPLPEGLRPLSGIQVLDLTRVIAGPVCGKTLAEHGADVLMITSPSLPFILPLVIDTGHGKKAAYLDLNVNADKVKLQNLVKKSDIFCQSYRTGGLALKGFSPQDLSQLNPGIIYVTLDAYTHLGPWATYHGFDSLVQSSGGIAWEQGDNESPQHLPAQSLDYITGYFGAIGAMECLRRRSIEGGSYHVRVSLSKTARWLSHLGRVSTNKDHIPTQKNICDLLITMESDFGTLTCLKPVLNMSQTTPYYTSPPVFLGSTKL
jgi:crotonobetainyl-CoA:carnitine CoA-transferase CaiB-like acyl-CoA transferase